MAISSLKLVGKLVNCIKAWVQHRENYSEVDSAILIQYQLTGESRECNKCELGTVKD